MILSFQVQLHANDAYTLGNAIISRSGLYKELHEDKTPEGVNRFDNLMELLNGLKEFSVKERNADEAEVFGGKDEAHTLRTLDEFMSEITLMTNADLNEDNEIDKKVKLMTIHSAKGLEFNYVFVAGMEENLFPGQLSIGSREDLEEERRLFYVAVTRAKKECCLSYANSRFKRGELFYCEPSRFLEELGDDFLIYDNMTLSKKINTKGLSELRSSLYTQTRKDYEFKSIGKLTKPGQGFIQKKNSNIDLDFNRNLKAGDTVYHEKFGVGKVLEISGSWPESRAVIQFNTSGNKHLMLKFACLQRME
jgi:DNA helicase-2/ATP-dependent DNA helicase PcrA